MAFGNRKNEPRLSSVLPGKQNDAFQTQTHAKLVAFSREEVNMLEEKLRS